LGIKDALKKPAREISKQISRGEKDPEHLGKYTPEMLGAYITALKQTKPAFRDSKWFSQYDKLLEEIQDKLKVKGNQRKYSGYLSRLKSIRASNEL